ncbi:HNH endonuclease, partial [Mesorhizobium japonicum]|uniref:HNH endonuclease n=1 Tax=Mesorhizobium japonicum TaxID=2066070 RepID=UPI003B59C4E0
MSKCGYCDTPDYYSGGRTGFHIDHFAPKSKFDLLKNEYNNLVYCCPICNLGKSDDWPGDNPNTSFMGDIGYIDPC